MDDDRDRRIAALLSSYYGSDDPKANAASALDIDSPQFNAETYVRDLFSNSSLNAILAKHNSLQQGLQSCQASLQSVVYKNYKKYIEACDQIKSMRDALNGLEPDMKALATTMESLSSATHHVSSSLASRRSTVEKLWRLDGMLGKVQFLVDLPQRLRADVDALAFSTAVDVYIHGAVMLARYDRILSFRRIAADADAILADLVAAARVYVSSVGAGQLPQPPQTAAGAPTGTAGTGSAAVPIATSTADLHRRATAAASALMSVGMPSPEIAHVGLAACAGATVSALSGLVVLASTAPKAVPAADDATPHPDAAVAGVAAGAFEFAVVAAIAAASGLAAGGAGSSAVATAAYAAAKAALADVPGVPAGVAAAAASDARDAALVAVEPVESLLRRVDAAVAASAGNVRALFNVLRAAASSLGLTDASFVAQRESDAVAAVAVPVYVAAVSTAAAAVARRAMATVWAAVCGPSGAVAGRAAVVEPAIATLLGEWTVAANGLAASMRVLLPPAAIVPQAAAGDASAAAQMTALMKWCAAAPLGALAVPPPQRHVVPRSVQSARDVAIQARAAAALGAGGDYRGIGSSSPGRGVGGDAATNGDGGSIGAHGGDGAEDDGCGGCEETTAAAAAAAQHLGAPPSIPLAALLSDAADRIVTRHIVPLLSFIPSTASVAPAQIVSAAAVAKGCVACDVPHATQAAAAAAAAGASAASAGLRGAAARGPKAAPKATAEGDGAAGADPATAAAGSAPAGGVVSAAAAAAAALPAGQMHVARAGAALLDSAALALTHMYCRTLTLHTYGAVLPATLAGVAEADMAPQPSRAAAARAARQPSEGSAATDPAADADNTADPEGSLPASRPTSAGFGTARGDGGDGGLSGARPRGPSAWVGALVEGMRASAQTLHIALPPQGGLSLPMATRSVATTGVAYGPPSADAGAGGFRDEGSFGGADDDAGAAAAAPVAVDYRTPPVLRKPKVQGAQRSQHGLGRRHAAAIPAIGYSLPDEVGRVAIMGHLLAFILKSILETVRGSTLSLADFRQLQVDIYVLRTATARWAADPVAHHAACDAVLAATVDRCVAPGGAEPLEPSEVDAACVVRLSSLCL